MKLNYNDWNILKNQLNNINKKRAKILYNITNELKKYNINNKRKSKLIKLQIDLIYWFELNHNIKFVDDDFFLNHFVKNYDYYINNVNKISLMTYDYVNSDSYIDFDNINTENDNIFI
tara:strand:+ start:264 stop:617 length:354 start_codon:yes stop_codon:yes gene_type:complete